MPFMECTRVSQREEFCRLARSSGANVRELCRRFGISPQTGYRWLGRYGDGTAADLGDRSRRPHGSPRQTSEAIEAAVLAARDEYRTWGGRKIRRLLQNRGASDVPSASTITAILRRHGRLDGPGAGAARDYVRFEHAQPNDLWQMDFKGHFALERGRCHPLTVLDDHSRYALELGACGDERRSTVQARLEAVFRRYGLPRRILCDNGPPWGTTGSGDRFTKLGVWLLDLGIAISHGRPYHPQTQGKDERFHRSLKAEVLDGRLFTDLGHAGQAFDTWRRIYNEVRPHEGIGLTTPADRYAPSPRSMPQTVASPEYEPHAHVRTVSGTGWFGFRSRKLFCSKAFAGKRIALRATSQDGVFDLCYRRHVLMQVDLHQNVSISVTNVSEHPSPLSPV